MESAPGKASDSGRGIGQDPGGCGAVRTGRMATRGQGKAALARARSSGRDERGRWWDYSFRGHGLDWRRPGKIIDASQPLWLQGSADLPPRLAARSPRVVFPNLWR